MTWPQIISTCVSLIAITGVIVSLSFWRPRQKQFAIDEQRVRRWKCQDCGCNFGPDSTVLFYGENIDDAPILIEGKQFSRWVVTVCSHCQFLRCYDRSGIPWAIPGAAIDANVEQPC